MEQSPGQFDERGKSALPANQSAVEEAVKNLVRDPRSHQGQMEAAFLAALQGESISEIDRFQVYSHYSPEETVVFIHNPSGSGRHKYIFAETTEGHSYIVAAPTSWTGYHRDILRRVSLAHGSRASCPGGGYVRIDQEGQIVTFDRSVDFGRGDHERAKAALTRAVQETARREAH